jgi:APA family basic amino acid/polyamine antiporter
MTEFARKLGLFDATMIVMGGIIGSGIFINPYVVAQQLPTPTLILLAWTVGGVIALAGAFVYAELAARRPKVGGQYAYLREAHHPLIAFLYGWTLLLVIQTGGMAAVALTLARYLRELSGVATPDWILAVTLLGALSVVNCLGVRAGSTLQNVLMIIKIVAICGLILCGLFLAPKAAPEPYQQASSTLLLSFGAGLVPVLFAYGGFQTANFIAEEMRDPERSLSRGLVFGVAAVGLLYVGVNYVCVRTLGVNDLASTTTPASEVMRAALGDPGRRLIAAGIAVSTLGFLSQGMLTAPRVYFAMADDGVFFKRVGTLHPKTRVPVIAILLQGTLAAVIAASGRYEQILNYVVSADFIFFGLTGTCIFILRRKDAYKPARFHVPGHPFTTLFFVIASWLIVITTVYKYPLNSAIGIALILSGIPAFFFWRAKQTNGYQKVL